MDFLASKCARYQEDGRWGLACLNHFLFSYGDSLCKITGETTCKDSYLQGTQLYLFLICRVKYLRLNILILELLLHSNCFNRCRQEAYSKIRRGTYSISTTQFKIITRTARVKFSSFKETRFFLFFTFIYKYSRYSAIFPHLLKANKI